MPSLTPRIDKLDGYNNLIINGNMDFNQRGSAVGVNIANQAYSLDRFQYVKVGSMIGTVTQDASVPTASQSGFSSRFSYKYTVGTAQPSLGSTDQNTIRHFVEGQDYAQIAGGQQVRMQFWVRSSLAGTYGISFTNGAGDRSYVATYTILAANTWEKKTIDFTTDASGVWLLDNGRGLSIQWCLSCGSSFQTTAGVWQNISALSTSAQVNVNATIGNVFQLAQVSLVAGSFTANDDLPFKRAGKTIQQELAMCQRYYYRANADAIGTPFGFGFLTAVGEAYIIQHLPVSMRIASTSFTFSALSDFTIQTAGGTNASPNLAFGILSTNWSGKDMVTLTCSRNSTIGTAGDGAFVRALNTNAWTALDSEL